MKAYIKVLLVFAAFFLMVVSSSAIMYSTLNKKLSGHVEETVNDLRGFLSAELSDPEISLNFIADAIEGIIERGEGIDALQSYLVACSADEFKTKIHTTSYMSVYGYFDVFGAFYDGLSWDVPEHYSPPSRPWYVNAVEGGRAVVISKVYTDARADIPVLFYSRTLYDSHDRFLGVASISVPIDFVQNVMAGEHFSPGSYGYIADENLVIIVHPNETLLGSPLTEANQNLARAETIIRQGGDVSMHRTIDSRGVKSLLFSRKMKLRPENKDDWHIIFMVPQAEYYQELYAMTVIISVLGLLMAAALSLLLMTLDRARSKADIQNQQKSNFLANMSHEMRTPMNAIVGLTDLMMEENHSADTKENLRKINTAGHTLMGLISDVLDISKIEAGRLELVPEAYDVASLLNDIITLNLIRIEEKPVAFKLDIDGEMPSRLYGDDLRVKQILNNLLSNAFKYTHQGDVSLSVYCRRGNGGAMLSFVVSDTGVGIKKEDLGKLFDDYHQADTRANRSIEGTGLGLSITKSFVELMGGEITVESEYGKGTTFCVSIRQGFVSEEVLSEKTVNNLCCFRYTDDREQPHEKLSRPDLSYARVLLVDDFPTNLDVAAGMLRKYKMQVDCIDNGPEAVARVKAGEPVYDAIFMDHMMPDMDGMEATTLIRALDTEYAKHVPIIAQTANAVAGNEKMFLDEGFSAYLTKPLNVKALDAVVHRWVRDPSKE